LRAPVATALSAYKRGTLSFPQTRDELRTAMQRVGTVEYRPAS